jgi:hypothetical protein
VQISTASGQLRGQHEYKQNSNKITQDKTNKMQRKIDRLKLFVLVFKPEFLKIPLDLQTALAAEAHRAEGQCLEEQPNMVKSRMF